MRLVANGAGQWIPKQGIGKGARYVVKEGARFYSMIFSTGTKENRAAWPPDILDTGY